jgi:8-oxo-dGTP pyrophosphatase MutT (NUDIX family)
MNQEFENRPLFRAAAFLVMRKEGKVLLHKRINTSHEEGNYGLVSGHLDGKETAEEAIVREAMEEAGVEVSAQDLTPVHVVHNLSGNYEYFCIFFVTEKWKGEPKNMEPDRCGDLSWFPLSNLPDNTINYIRTVLERLDQGMHYTSFR